MINEKIKKIIEAILRIRSGRGYSAGHPIPINKPKPGLGKSNYEYEKIEDESRIERVEVSRAFKKEKK